MKKVMLAAMVALCLGAQAPAGCVEDEMAFTTKHVDMQIKGLVTPADGGTVFRDRPRFEAGLDITAGGISIAGPDVVDSMEGHIPVAASSSETITAPGPIDPYEVALLGRLEASEFGSNRAMRMEAFGQISGTTAAKKFYLVHKDDEGNMILLTPLIEIPQVYEGYFRVEALMTIGDGTTPRFSFMVLADLPRFEYIAFAIPTDEACWIGVYIEPADAGDTMEILQSAVLKIPN